jgi:hypothetical protein
MQINDHHFAPFLCAFLAYRFLLALLRNYYDYFACGFYALSQNSVIFSLSLSLVARSLLTRIKSRSGSLAPDHN